MEQEFLKIGDVCLEKTCENCNGEGETVLRGDTQPAHCIFCDGSGKTLSEDGLTLLEFVHKYVEVKLNFKTD